MPSLNGIFGLPYVFATRFKIDHRDQLALVEAARREGRRDDAFGVERCVQSFQLKSPPAISMPDRLLKHLLRHPADVDLCGVAVRFEPGVAWRWLDHPAAELVQELVRPIEGLFKMLSRVRITLVVPGKPLRSHRDLALGNVYSNMRSSYSEDFGRRTLAYRHHPRLDAVLPAPTRRHQDNLFLSAKIPLSENPDEPGRPFIIAGGQKLHYSSRNRIFFLNEVEVLHGADPVGYWRGLVNLQGILDAEAVRALKRVDCEFEPAAGARV